MKVTSQQLSAQLFATTPSSSASLEGFAAHALNGGQSAYRMRLAFAYATVSGTSKLLDAVRRVRNWSDIDSEWLLGLHHGLTEPAAVELAMSLPNSRVRVVYGGTTLRKNSLVAGERLHAKTIAVSQARRTSVSSVLVGSANLSRAALGDPANNFELGLEIHAPPARLGTAFNAWWTDAWAFGRPVTQSLLDSYASLRCDFLADNPEELHRLDPPLTETVQDARHLWMEVGAASGGMRNQIEFSSTLVAFFGPASSQRRMLTISFGGSRWTDRPLSPKTTTFGVQIWRLSLPSGVEEYPGRVVRLSKTDTGGYELAVVDVNSKSHRLWRTAASRAGHLGRTGSGAGREYGFW